METAPKKERLMLVFGFLLCAGLLAGHYFSGLSRNLAANRDLKIVLISGNAPMVFIYRSFLKTVTAVNLPRAQFKNSGSNYQKACAALALVSGATPVQREDVFYLVTDAQGGPDLSAFYETLNSWRSRPALFFKAAHGLWLLEKKERTNISFHDLLLAVIELSRLNSSNFIVTDFERGTEPIAQAPGSVADSARGPRQAGVTVADSAGETTGRGIEEKSEVRSQKSDCFLTSDLRPLISKLPQPLSVVGGQAGVSVESGDNANIGRFAGPSALSGQRIDAVPAPAAVIRVEVLNASGKKDLAMRVTKYLRKKGFDVIDFGTYTGAAKRTKIVNCSGNIDAARAVRSALGLTALEIYSKPEAGNVAEVSVVLGVDFNETLVLKR